MGCDIHMVLEKYDDITNKFVGIHSFPWVMSRQHNYVGWEVHERKYSLFSDLAGVRSDDNDKPQPLGVPSNISDLAQMLINEDGSDGHSHTHIMLDEAWPIFAAHFRGPELLETDRLQLCDRLFGVDADAANEYRLIIWFNN